MKVIDYQIMVRPEDFNPDLVSGMSPPYRGDVIRRVNRYFHHPQGNRLCSRCQNIKPLNPENFGLKRYYYDKDGVLVNLGIDPECVTCMIGRRAVRTKEIKSDYRRYCRSKLLAQLRFRAKEQGVPFDLSPEDLIAQWEEQDGFCWYTGKKLNLLLESNGNFPHRDFPSIDKRYPSRGYVSGNIAWMTYSVNRMKNDLDEDEFISFCKVVNANKG